MEEKTKSNNVLVIVLGVLVLLLAGFLVYDKVLNNNSQTEDESEACETTKIDYTNFDVTTDVPLACTIDMTGLTEVDIDDKCGENFYYGNDSNYVSYQIKVTNLKYNDTNYTFTYLLEKDTFFEREEDYGIVKMYIGSTLVEAHDGAYRNHFSSLKVDGNTLHTYENYPSDVPGYNLDIDLSKVIR